MRCPTCGGPHKGDHDADDGMNPFAKARPMGPPRRPGAAHAVHDMPPNRGRPPAPQGGPPGQGGGPGVMIMIRPMAAGMKPPSGSGPKSGTPQPPGGSPPKGQP